MLIVGGEHVDVTGEVVSYDYLPINSTSLLAVATRHDQAGTPTPGMGMHLAIRIGGEEVMEEERRAWTLGSGVPPGRIVPIEIGLAPWGDVLHGEGAGEADAPRPRRGIR